MRSSLAQRAGFDLLWDDLAHDVRRSIQHGIDRHAVFRCGASPLAIFRHALGEAVKDIESHARGRLIQQFVRDGPFDRPGRIPAAAKKRYLSDAETAAAAAFVHGHMVNCFQGALAELLAIRPCQELLAQLIRSRRVPRSTRLYVGDSVRAARREDAGLARAADFHFLATQGKDLRLVGLGEVKSFRREGQRLASQVESHRSRAIKGLVLDPCLGVQARIDGEHSSSNSFVRILVRPSSWKLPRGFRLATRHGKTIFEPEAPAIPKESDAAELGKDGEWRITLRWSHEALAAVAFGVSFWYMERVGESLFSLPASNPWPEMSPAEAGANAAKASLYYAILRARDRQEASRAIALYNTYGFGYAVGMNFRNASGRREMLWPADLRALQSTGATPRARIVRSILEVPGAIA